MWHSGPPSAPHPIATSDGNQTSAGGILNSRGQSVGQNTNLELERPLVRRSRVNRAFQLPSKALPTGATCGIGAAKLILEPSRGHIGRKLLCDSYNGAGSACLMCGRGMWVCRWSRDAFSQFSRVVRVIEGAHLRISDSSPVSWLQSARCLNTWVIFRPDALKLNERNEPSAPLQTSHRTGTAVWQTRPTA